MKRTALKRKTPLRRKAPMRNKRTSTYAQRPRDLDYMAWIRTRVCTVGVAIRVLKDKLPLELMTPCFGRIEADHVGERPMGQKADDRTTVPLCQGHHLQRTTFSGFFKNWTREGMREWAIEEVEFHQGNYDRWLKEQARG